MGLCDLNVLNAYVSMRKTTGFIADIVMPKVSTAKDFGSMVYNEGDIIPDDRIRATDRHDPYYIRTYGEKSLHQTELRTMYTDVTKEEIEKYESAARMGNKLINPYIVQVGNLMHQMELQRESRVAAFVGDKKSYLPENVKVLTGTSKWSEYPDAWIKDVHMAQTKLTSSDLVLVVSKEVWTVISGLTISTSAVMGTEAAVVISSTKKDLLDRLGIKDIVIGKNKTEKGGKLWGNNAALLSMASIESMESADATGWGYTAIYYENALDKWDDPMRGGRGGVENVKISTDSLEFVNNIAGGFLFKDVI